MCLCKNDLEWTSLLFPYNAPRNSDKKIYMTHGRRQVQQSGVDNMGWRGVSPPQSEWDIKFFFWSGVFWLILSELVWTLPWCNSLQFWCAHTVTNRFYHRNWLTCTAIWNFPVKCTTCLVCHKQNLSISISLALKQAQRICIGLRKPSTVLYTLWKKWGGQLDMSTPIHPVAKTLTWRDHRLRGSASPVLTATGFVNGKGRFSTRTESTPLNRSPKHLSQVITSAIPTAVPN